MSRLFPLSMSRSAAAATDELVRKQYPRRPPSSSVTKVTVDSVLQHIAKNPGSSSGDYDMLKRVWLATSHIIGETMRKGKGVSIPGFAIFSLQRKRANRGNLGEKVELLPTFCLLPSFCQSFGLASTQTVQGSSLGAVPTSPLNTVAIAMRAGVAKDMCGAAIKDVWRKLGELACKGATFSVDFGVARIVFHMQRCEAHWNTALLAQLQQLCNGTNHKMFRPRAGSTFSRGSQKHYTADSTVPKDVKMPDRHPPQGAAVAKKPAAFKESEIRKMTQADDDAVSSVRSQLSKALSQDKVYSPNGVAPEYTTVDGSPRMYLGSASACGTVRSNYNEKYASRLRNKVLYRRARNKAYTAAWEEQKRAKEQHMHQEREKDKARLQIMQERARLEEEDCAREAAEGRRVARMVQAANREKAESPKQKTPTPTIGEQFWGREIRPVKPNNISHELKMLEEQKLNKKKEKLEQDKHDLEMLRQQQRLWEEEEAEEKRHRQAEQREMFEAYKTHKSNKEDSYGQKDTSYGGNFFFKSLNAGELADDEREERAARRKAALEVQQENEKSVQRARSRAKIAEGLKKNSEKKAHVRNMRQVMSIEAEGGHGKKEKVEEMRSAWEAQIREKAAAKQRKMEENRRKAQTLHAWRNESSDEEYDDYIPVGSHKASPHRGHTASLSPRY